MKAGIRRSEKYDKKIDGTISQLRLLRYGKEQKTKFKQAVIKQIGIERVVKSLVSGSTTAMLLHFYCDFAKKVVQLSHRHKGDNLINELNILDNIWTSRGLDSTLLHNIKAYFVPAYAPPIPCSSYLTQEECEDAGCYWWGDACHSTPAPACAWLYKMKLTFSGNVSATNLDDFPVLVHLTNANFNFAHAKANGEDIRFMDSDLCPSEGTPLKHEIEKWDQAGQEAWVWVKVPRIDGDSVVDFIYMYYGNNAAADGQDPPNVWNTNYVMVHHMKDDPDTSHVSDSTANNSDGTKKDVGDPAETTGKMWKGQLWDGTSEWIKVLDNAGLRLAASDGTLEMWVLADHTGASENRRLIEKFSDATSDGYEWWETAVNYKPFLRLDSVNASANTGIPADGNFHHVAVSWDGTKAHFYLDGDSDGDPNLAKRPASSTSDLRMGCYSDESQGFWKGKMDEVRISNVCRSADWIKAQYRSMADVLITYGAEQSS